MAGEALVDSTAVDDGVSFAGGRLGVVEDGPAAGAATTVVVDEVVVAAGAPPVAGDAPLHPDAATSTATLTANEQHQRSLTHRIFAPAPLAVETCNRTSDSRHERSYQAWV